MVGARVRRLLLDCPQHFEYLNFASCLLAEIDVEYLDRSPHTGGTFKTNL